MSLRNRCPVVLVAAALVAFITAPAEAADEPVTTRVSVSTNGIQSKLGGLDPAINADGGFVAFISSSDDLVPDDTNGVSDVFVRDLRAGVTTRVSVNSVGVQGTGASSNPAMSADGRFVAFQSAAADLVTGDTNGHDDVFIHDSQTGQTTRVSVKSGGVQSTGDSYGPSLSADGRIIAFLSDATDLVPGDTNLQTDVFVHDRSTGQTNRVNVGPSAVQANNYSAEAVISGDGRVVAFASDATNLLVAGDGNARRDVFIHDLASGQTRRVSNGLGGAEANGISKGPSLNADGSVVAYRSGATNLVPGDTNMTDDVFVTRGSRTVRVSLGPKGVEANSGSADAHISDDGLSVAFISFASNLVPHDTNSKVDVFLSRGGKVTRMSAGPSGADGDNHSFPSAISADGRVVAFVSEATNLINDDTNANPDIFISRLKSTHQGFELFPS